MSHNTRQNRQPRAPLHLCALTLNPHTNPVAAPDGTVFEGSTIRQLVRRTGLNPITGTPLLPDSLVTLSFNTDPRDSLPRCPILFHSFNQNIKIVAIATSGNVYSFAAIQRLNIHPCNMTDLIDRTPFTMDDIIVLFDPQVHIWSTEFQELPDSHPALQLPRSHHVSLVSSPLVGPSHKLAPAPPDPAGYRFPSPEYPQHHSPITTTTHSSSQLTTALPVPTIRSQLESISSSQHQHYIQNSSPRFNQPSPLPSPSAQPIRSSELPHRIQPGVAIHPPPYPSTTPSYSSLSPSNQINSKRVQKQLEPSPIPKKARLHPTVEPTNTQYPSNPIPDTKHSALTYFERKKAEDERKAVYKRIRKGRKGKGYVRVVTNIGHLNIELHCDKVPMTCDNFFSLAQAKYYDGLRWHRVIPNFIAQTGDPSGTGQGGDSFWGGYFKDEIRTSLQHDGAGIVSMANSGRDTNLSQWFICLDAAPHLDGSHTVFGKVVGGLYVLKKIESEAEMGHPLTVETVEILVNPIRQIREQMKKASIPQQVPNANNTGTTIAPQGNTAPSNKPSALHNDPTRQDTSLPLTVGVKHPAIHPEAQQATSYAIPNHIPQSMQENLPPARTLLSAANLPRNDR